MRLRVVGGVAGGRGEGADPKRCARGPRQRHALAVLWGQQKRDVCAEQRQEMRPLWGPCRSSGTGQGLLRLALLFPCMQKRPKKTPHTAGCILWLLILPSARENKRLVHPLAKGVPCRAHWPPEVGRGADLEAGPGDGERGPELLEWTAALPLRHWACLPSSA